MHSTFSPMAPLFTVIAAYLATDLSEMQVDVDCVHFLQFEVLDQSSYIFHLAAR